jgi:nidogen (entactin)
LIKITFESCPHTDHPAEVNSLAGTVKTSKITLSYESRENALRIGMLSKVGATDKLNPCYDGTSNCGDNTICVPTGEDNYEVIV